MNQLFKDQRLYFILASNMLSSIGSGISMIAIPWTLISREDGSVIYGYVTLALTILMFFITPSIGLLIDRFSRKSILHVANFLGFISLVFFVYLGYRLGDYPIWYLISIYSIGSLYYTVFYPTMFAFCQEIFDKKHYKSINGLLEVQSQASTIMAGALASLLLGKIDLIWIIIMDAFSFGAAFFILLLVPYYQTFVPASTRHSFFYQLSEGFLYMKQAPMLFLFFMASFLPFIGVMMTNYLYPIYIHEVLEADASVYGATSMMYSVGATLAGIILPLLLRTMNQYAAIILTFTSYLIGLLFLSLIPLVPIFLLMQILTGLGNAGTRVVRNSIMMAMIPTDKMGRVNSLFQLIGLAIRVGMLLVFTNALTLIGSAYMLILLCFLIFIAYIAMVISIKKMNSAVSASVT